MVEKVFLTVLRSGEGPKCLYREGIPQVLHSQVSSWRGRSQMSSWRGRSQVSSWRGYSLSVFEERTFPSVFVLIPKFLPGEGIPKCLCGEDVPKCLRGEGVPNCTGGEDVPNCGCEDICCSVRDGVAILFWCLDLLGSSEETAVHTSLLTGILR